MPRCENCGKENPATICASCLHYKKKQERLAATEAATPVAPRKPAAPPDLDALRERLRVVEETLAADDS